jgi:uncharacterized membrane protein
LCPDKPCPGKSSANISKDGLEGEELRSNEANRLNDAALSSQPWRHKIFFVGVLVISSLLLLLRQHLATSFTPSLHVNVRSVDETVVVMLRTLFDSVVAAIANNDFFILVEVGALSLTDV